MWLILKKIITAPFVALAALVVGFSEWLWQPLLSFIHRLTKWRGFRWIEASVRKLPPWAALLLFALPALALLPFKLLGLYLIAHGKKVLGLGVFLAAKVVGTGLLAWVYSLTEPALETFAWFVKLRVRYRSAKTWLYTQVKTSFIWRQSKTQWQKVRATARQFLAQWR